jgi:hypothetical protein
MTSKLRSSTRKGARLELLGVKTFVSEETILGRKLARASKSSTATTNSDVAATACSLMLFELLSARQSKLTRIDSPRAGILAVAVSCCFPWALLEDWANSSAIHLSASVCSSSEDPATPFWVEVGLAIKVNKMSSCPDRSGARERPHPVRRRTDMHWRQSSRARTGTVREILKTCEMGTKTYSANLESTASGLELTACRALSSLVKASTRSFLWLGLCASVAVTCSSSMQGCFSCEVSVELGES